MKSQQQVLDVLSEQKDGLIKRYGVRSMALFGSYARDDQGESSDIDILIDVDPAIGLRFVNLADEIEATLGEHVELVSTRAVNQRAKKLIDAELIYV